MKLEPSNYQAKISKETPIWVKFSCGCVYPVNDQVWIKTKSNGSRRCREHDTKQVSRIGACIVCGKVQEVTIFNKTVKFLCSKECKLRNKKQWEQLYAKRACYLKKQPMLKITHPDCKFYTRCLNAVCMNPNVTHVDCKDCIRYTPEELNIEDYLLASDVMDSGLNIGGGWQ